MFIKTPAGKFLPVDPDPVDSSDMDFGDKLVTEDGEIKTVNEFYFEGYIPHWSTCPKADDFRKKR